MNRIVLIGNGFDLAHGMNTSYSHFINDYWTNIITLLRTKAESNTTIYGIAFENEEIIVDKLHGPWGETTKIDATNYQELLANLNSQKNHISFKNKFFEIISDKSHLQNWVDIENEYYSVL